MLQAEQDKIIEEIAAMPVKMVSVVEIDNGFIIAAGKKQLSVDSLYEAQKLMIKLFDQKESYSFGRNPAKEPEKTIEELEDEQERIDGEDLGEIEKKVEDLEVTVETEEKSQEAESLQENNTEEAGE